MASEQFSLCWDNFHKNMSSGMQSLLESEDLVDVTLAVEGRYLKAHKMVLSVCSPYFRELFQSNPCKHPIVFMKDVSYIALSDLLQFMYQGEVQVAQENLTTFIKTAEALQIKGLTGDSNSQNESETPETPEIEKPAIETIKRSHEVVVTKPVPTARVKKPAGPASKRARFTLPAAESSTAVNPMSASTPVAITRTKSEVSSVNAVPTSEELIQFKMEPTESADQSHVEELDDSQADRYGDESTMDDMQDDTEDYSLMETGDDEPKAGTSADGMGDGQAPYTPTFNFVSLTELYKNEFEEEKLPSDVEEQASEAMGKLLPQKSQMVYEKEYKCFQKWKSAKNINSVSEKVLLAYFSEKSKKVKPPTLWSYYSMLKCTLLANENCDISKYSKLITLLKKLSDGYKPKKSKIFEPDDVIRFLKEASDDDYLIMKVVAIMGLYGAARSDELYKLEVSNVDDRESVMVVSLIDTKTKKDRSFCITDKECGVSVLQIVRKYVALRPKNVSHKKFFINYRQKKGTIQPVGINTLYKVPMKIADFLKLPNPEMFTGHCFRRSAATMFANSDESEIYQKPVKRKQPHTAFIKDGFVYHQNSRKANSAMRYLACSEYKKLVCHARATIPMNGSLEDLVVTREHNHPPARLVAEKNVFIKQLKTFVQFAPHSSLKELYHSVEALHPQAAEVCTYNKLLSSMRRWRSEALDSCKN